MNFIARPLSRLTMADKRILLHPAAIAAILVEAILVLHQVFDPAGIHPARLGVTVGSMAYTLLLFLVLYPASESQPWVNWILTIANAGAIALLAWTHSFPTSVIISILAGTITIVTILFAGRGPVYLFIGLVTIVYLTTIEPASTSEHGTWVYLLGIPVLFVVIVEVLMRLSEALMAQMRRLETLNSVARRVAGTIEMNQVLSLFSSAIQEAFQGDTYYLGVLNGDLLHLELLYDDGEFFPPLDIEVKGSLAGWVATNGRSLLMGNVPNDALKIGIEVQVVGKPKTSLSWMGTPLMTADRVIGMVAVASYQKNAFGQHDLELLESVAQQAALALDNAYHHSEVEEQSRLDSLTQVYTHGYFLARLAQEAENSIHEGRPLSLIMLDIDFFKQYNDEYGHLVGDQVLTSVAATIRRYTKKTDVIGRWGGEEFAVLLLNATLEQSLMVAERIRQTLANLTITGRNGESLPAPTCSQGVATFPSEANDVDGLIHLADMRLYVAKRRGRNQVDSQAIHLDEVELQAGPAAHA